VQALPLQLLPPLTPEELNAIKLSLRVATWATLASLPVGVMVAIALARGRF
jgi:molybdate transport system permease protein